MSERVLRCSFCAKRKDEVLKFVSGPGVYICNECIALCNEIMAEDGGLPPGELWRYGLELISPEELKLASEAETTDVPAMIQALVEAKPKSLVRFVKIFNRLLYETVEKALGPEYMRLIKEEVRLGRRDKKLRHQLEEGTRLIERSRNRQAEIRKSHPRVVQEADR